MVSHTVEMEKSKARMIAIRRDLHKYPEPGWTEFRTAALVATELQRLGYQIVTGPDACRSESRMGVPDEATLRSEQERAIQEGADPYWVNQFYGGHTAVVGILKGTSAGPVVALRFDMDSNDIEESREASHLPEAQGFRSVHPLAMHACGHDGHTAIGLGVAELLMIRRSEIAGEVRLLFQPAEEGCRGAKSMVEAGWLDGVDYFFAGHIGIKSKVLGEIVASTNGFLATTKIDAEFRGQSAHAGEVPERGNNALLAAASAALHLHGISRHSEGTTRINVGVLEAGSGRNVIPDHALLKLETRGETASLNTYMEAEAVRILENVGNLYEVTCDWRMVGRGEGADCSQELIPFIEQEAKKDHAVGVCLPSIRIGASEDVTYMLRRVQEQGGRGSFMLFGSPLKAGHHHPLFDYDEDVLPIAAGVLVRLVIACPTWRFPQ